MAVKVTKKKPLKGNDRSHALNTSKRARKLNLQVVKLENGKKVRMTVREKRTLYKDNKMDKNYNADLTSNEIKDVEEVEKDVENEENEEISE